MFGVTFLRKTFLSVPTSKCTKGTNLKWMHVYPESVPKEKDLAGKPAKDSSSAMAVMQTGDVKDARDETENKNDRKELDYKL